SQSWNEHEAWHPDAVITVCDQAAAEQCPVWFGNSLKAHWGLADPSRLDGNEEELACAFKQTISTLRVRIETLLSSNLQSMDNAKRLALLNALGKG
ncbi:MAG: arsenate reductase ArsC, partial [Halioglobus sp.]|nr:arsenate reductase ArsC [Halioglobus sp.]